MGIWKSLAGTLKVQITTASSAELFNALNDQHVPFLNIEQCSDLSVVGEIYRKDFKRFKKIMQRRGEDFDVLNMQGLYWAFAHLRARPVFVIGCILFLFIALFLPTRVLFITVDGNATIQENKILEAAERCGIGFGASRRAVRSERVKNALLSEIPELQWAGINTYGCTAVISIKERATVDMTPQVYGVSSIVAKSDGVISQLTVTQGNVLCKVGQAVKRGQVLVSGYTDCGIAIKAESAEAEILALTSHKISLITPLIYEQRVDLCGSQTRYTLKIGKKLIKLCKGSGISDSKCVKMYEEQHLTLPGGFQLPVSLITERTTYYRTQNTNETSEHQYDWTKDFVTSYLSDHMLAGRIISSSVSQHVKGAVFCHYGVYVCEEMIGYKRSEEIVDNDGKRN